MTWLALMPAGSRAVVSSLPAGHNLAKRMIALGLTPGAQVKVLQNRGRGPLLIEVHCARLALGWGQAAKVAVEPVSDDELAAVEACPGDPDREG